MSRRETDIIGIDRKLTPNNDTRGVEQSFTDNSENFEGETCEVMCVTFRITRHVFSWMLGREKLRDAGRDVRDYYIVRN